MTALACAAAASMVTLDPDAAQAAPPWGEPRVLSAEGELVARPIEFVHRANDRGDAVAAWTTVVSGQRVARVVTRELGRSWSTPTTVSDSERAGIIGGLDASINGSGNIVLVWSRSLGGTGLDAEQVSIDAAIRPAALGTWQPAAQISPDFGNGGSPEVVLDNAGNVTAVWLAGDNSEALSIAGATRGPDGGPWMPAAPATPRPGILSTPDLSINAAGTALVSWRDFPGGPPSAWSARKPQGGVWAETIDLPLPPPGEPGLNIIGAPNTEILPSGEAIALMDEPPSELSEPRRLLQSSADADGPWSAFKLIGGQPTAVRIGSPALTIAGDGTAYAIWSPLVIPSSGGGGQSTTVVSSRPPGGTWAAPTRLSPEGVPSSRVSIDATRRGAAQVTWTESRGATVVTAARRRDPRSGSFGPREEISRSAREQVDVSCSGFAVLNDGRAFCIGVGPKRRIVAADRDRSVPGDIRLTRQQLLINQRISQAALRRANAALQRVRAGLTGADLRDGALGSNAFAMDLAVSGSASGSLAGGTAGRPFASPSPDRTGARVRVTSQQLLINQRISQAALRRANALRRGLARGVTAVNFKPGSITAADVAPGIRLAPTNSTVVSDGADAFRVAPPSSGPDRPLRVSRGQLATNQRIGQVAVRRANAIVARLEAGLTGADVRPGSITSAVVDLD